MGGGAGGFNKKSVNDKWLRKWLWLFLCGIKKKGWIVDIEQDFESIAILRISTRQYKRPEYLKFSSSLPEKPYIDQQTQEMSEMPERR